MLFPHVLLSCFWSSLLVFHLFFTCLSFCLDSFFTIFTCSHFFLTPFSHFFTFPMTFGKLLYVLHKVSIQIPSNLHSLTDFPDVNEGNIPQVGRGLKLIVGWPSPKKSCRVDRPDICLMAGQPDPPPEIRVSQPALLRKTNGIVQPLRPYPLFPGWEGYV